MIRISLWRGLGLQKGPRQFCVCRYVKTWQVKEKNANPDKQGWVRDLPRINADNAD
jgi:hypothetical protein